MEGKPDRPVSMGNPPWLFHSSANKQRTLRKLEDLRDFLLGRDRGVGLGGEPKPTRGQIMSYIYVLMIITRVIIICMISCLLSYSSNLLINK